jgi:hypothetical protein
MKATASKVTTTLTRSASVFTTGTNWKSTNSRHTRKVVATRS